LMMAIVIERQAKTVTEAAISACEELGIPRSEVDIEVLEEGSKGVLGIGSRNARIRVRVKNENLSEKGLRAKKALESILNYLIPTFSVLLKEGPEKIRLDIKDTNDKGLLIGKRGEMIKSLEYIVGKIAGKNCEGGRDKRVAIDIDGYKRRKEDNISKLVKETARKVRKMKKPVSLEPMSASERRIAYLTLRREGGVTYETKIEQEQKRIIITPLTKGQTERSST
ncbi:MAG TPA: Jag N-terminal domain-containing protein, partial [Thermodesulfobacteriota bacterium]|nr:Jag N-terminal domain-containing protein [Thermodesulfobacteriota bacterium]